MLTFAPLVERPEPDILHEASRLTRAIDHSGLPLRALGGIAVHLHAHEPLPPALTRRYEDIDLVCTRKASKETRRLLLELGYEPNERFNTINGAHRLVFYDVLNRRRLDVFVGEFRMCHAVPIADRIELEPHTVPLAELLLTKLQVVRLNEKDLKDIWSLLLEHDVGDADAETINAALIARVLAADWGFWRTSRQTVEQARERLPGSGLGEHEQGLIERRLGRLWERVEDEPKSLRWRSRAKLGERGRWYAEPEEIAHGVG